MSITVNATGNIGTNPRVRVVTVGTSKKEVVDFSVYLDNLTRLDDGSYKDRGGFWAQVTLWPERNAETIATLYQKGQRVAVVGQMAQRNWVDEKTGEKRSLIQVNAQSVGILPNRIEEIRMKPKSDVPLVTGSQDTDGDCDDIPF